MEWYYESEGEELVPSEQPHVVSESVQLASDRWSQWGIYDNINFDSPNKYFVGDLKYSGEIHSSHNKFSDEVEMDLFGHERNQSSALTELSAQTPNASALCSVFTEDRSRGPRGESCQNDENFMPEWDKAKVVDLSEHSTIDTYCGKTEVWDFSLSSEHNNTNFVALHHPSVSEERDFASVRAHAENVSAHAENESIYEYGNETMSVEEALLLDFELVMNQMSEKTRYCFRDALYRLAKNSESPGTNQNGCDDTSVSIPCKYVSTGEESSRDEFDRSIEESEAKTNTIDRAVASLMFSNMNFSLEDHHQQA